MGMLGAGCLPAAIIAWVTGASAPFETKLTKSSVSGSFGGFGSATLKLSADVRSPEIARRQGVMCVSITPNRFSMNWITEVWSNTCEQAQPPRLQGDTTKHGTRAPRP